MKNKVILIGGFHETIEVFMNSKIIIKGIVDFNDIVAIKYNIPYLGNDDLFVSKKLYKYPLSITSDKPYVRQMLFTRYFVNNKYQHFDFISKGAILAKSTSIGKHISIMNGAHLSSSVVLGEGVRINCFANIMHDCFIGNFTTIAPNAVILGNVKVGNNSYIGANSTILPNIIIGENSIIGAGSVVTHDIPPNKIYCGNPARFLKDNNE